MGSKRNRLREKKKRTFKGNQFQSKERAAEKKINVNEDAGPSSPSSTDCKATTVQDPQIAEKSDQTESQAEDVYILIYMPLLAELFCEYARCPEPDCDSPNVGNNLNSFKKKGLCNSLTVVCFECSYESEYVTSNKQSQHARTGAGRHFF